MLDFSGREGMWPHGSWKKHNKPEETRRSSTQRHYGKLTERLVVVVYNITLNQWL